MRDGREQTRFGRETDVRRSGTHSGRMDVVRKQLGHGWDADSNRPASDDGRIQIAERIKSLLSDLPDSIDF